jgi:hypothetical protein
MLRLFEVCVRIDECAHRRQPAEQGTFSLAFENAFGRPGDLEAPDVLKRFFELPGAVDRVLPRSV